jgi:hypothetical protein
MGGKRGASARGGRPKAGRISAPVVAKGRGFTIVRIGDVNVTLKGVEAPGGSVEVDVDGEPGSPRFRASPA